MDEKEGPFVVMRGYATPSQPETYSICEKVKDTKPFFLIVVPNAGTGEMARKLCNLLNKAHKEKTDEHEAAGVDGGGILG